MKKAIFSVSITLCLLYPAQVFARDFFQKVSTLALTPGLEISEIALLQAWNGRVFILLAAGDSFSVYASGADGSGTLKPYVPEGLPDDAALARSFSSVSIGLMCFGAFLSDERLHLLSIGPDSELRYLPYEVIQNYAPDSYQMMPRGDAAPDLFVLEKGLLSYLPGDGAPGLELKKGVFEFDAFWNPALECYQGYYALDFEYWKAVVPWMLRGDSIVTEERLGIVSKDTIVSLHFNDNGEPLYVLGNEVLSSDAAFTGLEAALAWNPGLELSAVHGGLLLREAQSGDWQEIPAEHFAAGMWLNGSLYVAALSDGHLTLFRIGEAAL
jgi:hypothetical protein